MNNNNANPPKTHESSKQPKQPHNVGLNMNKFCVINKIRFENPFIVSY